MSLRRALVLIAGSIREMPIGDALAAAPVLTVAGTTYTAALTDANCYLRCTTGTALALTIPPHSSVALPLECVLIVEQGGAGTVTLTAGAGVTLNSRGGLLHTAGQFAVVQLKQVAIDVWTVLGDVA